MKNKIPSLFFEKWKWNWNGSRSWTRSENEKKFSRNENLAGLWDMPDPWQCPTFDRGGIHWAINAYYMIMLIKALTTNHAFYGWKMFIKCFDPLRCILSKVSHEKHLIHPTPSAPIILKHFNIVVCCEVVGLKKSNSKWKCINHTNLKLHANSQKKLFCLLVYYCLLLNEI